MQKIVKLNQAFLYCCMVVMFCLHSISYAAPTQGKPVSITIKNSTLAEVLRQVSKKSGLYIYFQDADLAAHKNVTIDVRNKPVENVLHELLDGRGLSWVEVSENTIAVKKKLEVEERRIEGDSAVTITVTGRVVNEKGEPLPGATIKVKNSNFGVTADANGKFSLSNIDKNAHLIISSLSYYSYELSAKGLLFSEVIKLKEYVSELDIVQIQAYGTTSKRISTSNIGTVKSSDIEKQPINNPILAIQGRIPGVFVEQGSGLSGTGIQVRIQGLNSIGKGNDPLYVIDGVPYTSQLLSTNNNSILGQSGTDVGSYGAQNGNPLSFINPSDIESIDVLKDADATAIYGSRAANGAILITTKKGRIGETKFELNLQNGWGNVPRRVKLLDTQQYIEIRKEALRNNNNRPPSPSDYDLNGTWQEGAYTDWQKELIGGTSAFKDVQASISGGNQLVQFLIGAGYHRETTVFPGKFDDQKGTVHFSITNSSKNERLRTQFSGNYLVDKNDLPGFDLTNNALILPPNAPKLYNTDGTLNWAPTANGNSSFNNPLAAFLFQNQFVNTRNLLSNLNISYQLLSGLTIKTSLGYNDLQSDGTNYTKIASIKPEEIATTQRSATYSKNRISSWIIEPQLNYNTDLLHGKLDVLIGSSIQRNTTNGQLQRAVGFSSDLLLDDIGSATNTEVPTTTNSLYRYNALFARINYNKSQKYIINLTARRDGSSRFGSKNHFHNFGSAGVAWIFSNENVIKNLSSILSFGKFRGSFGTTGNDQIGDYTYLNSYQNSPNYGVPYQGVSGLEPTALPNPYIQWEKTTKIQLGLDLGFFDDKVLISGNYYRNRSSNQILRYALSIVSGFDGIASNFPATVQNTGIEISVNTSNITRRNLTWTSSFNITIPRNKLVDFPNLEKSSYFSSALAIGQPLSLIKVYKYSGVNPENGLYEVVDAKGVKTSNPNPLQDRTEYINNSPTLYGGLSNSIKYKGFQLDFLFQFVKQIAANNFFGNFPGFRSNQPTHILSRWKKPGDVAEHQKITTNFEIFTTTGAAVASDRAYTDASYIRLKNISLSWQFPELLKNKLKLQNLRLFMNAQNVLTITKYKGLDPESKSLNRLPPLRVITVGVNVGI